MHQTTQICPLGKISGHISEPKIASYVLVIDIGKFEIWDPSPVFEWTNLKVLLNLKKRLPINAS